MKRSSNQLKNLIFFRDYFVNLQQAEICIPVMLFLVFSYQFETSSKPLNISNYQYTIEMLSPRCIWMDNCLKKVVVVRTIKDQLIYFDHDDPTRTVKSTILRDIDKFKIEQEIFEGSLIRLDRSSIQLIVMKNRIPAQRLSRYEIISEDHQLGQVLIIPARHIKSITVWKKRKASKGALIGAGAGALFSAMLTIFDDQIQSESGNQMRYVQNNIPFISPTNHLSRGQFFLSSCLITVPVGASIGAIIGTGRKKQDYYIIYGTTSNYHKATVALNDYMKRRNPK